MNLMYVSVYVCAAPALYLAAALAEPLKSLVTLGSTTAHSYQPYETQAAAQNIELLVCLTSAAAAWFPRLV